MSEQRIVERIKRRLEARGATVVKTQGTRYRRGEPDLVACYPLVRPGMPRLGLYVAIEVKTPTGEPTPIQLARIRAYIRSGGIAFWTDSPETVIERIEREIDDRIANTPIAD